MPAPAPRSHRSRSCASRKTILIIEDEPLNRQVITRYLGILGYRVLQSDRGDEGLTEALNSSPDLLLIDSQLPGLSGIELVTRLRRAGRTTPVVMFSAFDLDSELSKQAQALGVRAFLRKPFPFRKLGTLVENTLHPSRWKLTPNRFYYRQSHFSLTAHDLAAQLFHTLFREGLDMAGHVHFHIEGYTDHLVLLCTRRSLGKVVAKSTQCRPGECLPWDRSDFREYNPEKVIQELSQQINQVRIDAAGYQMSWPTLADFLCWLELSY